MEQSAFVQNAPCNSSRLDLQSTSFFGSRPTNHLFCVTQNARKANNRRYSVQNAFRDIEERPDGEIPARLPPPASLPKSVVAKVFVCTKKDCCKKGSENVLAALSEAATPDIQVRSCGCLGKCSKGPAVRVVAGKDSVNKRLFTKVSSKSPSQFLDTVKEMATPRTLQKSADLLSSRVSVNASKTPVVAPVETFAFLNRLPSSTRTSAPQTSVVKSNRHNSNQDSHPAACLACGENELCNGWGLSGCPCGMHWKTIPVLDEFPRSQARVERNVTRDHSPVRLMLFDE